MKHIPKPNPSVPNLTTQPLRTLFSTLLPSTSRDSLSAKRKPSICKPKADHNSSKLLILQDTLLEETLSLREIVKANKLERNSREGSNVHQIRVSSAPKVSKQSDGREKQEGKEVKVRKAIRLEINLKDIIKEHSKKPPEIRRQIQTIISNKILATQHKKQIKRNPIYTIWLQPTKQNSRINTQSTTCQN